MSMCANQLYVFNCIYVKNEKQNFHIFTIFLTIREALPK